MKSRTAWGRVALLIFSAVLIACDKDKPNVESKAAIVLQAWFHSGQAGERKTILDQVARFNLSQKEIKVELSFIPEGAYNAQVQAAALAGELPDLLEFDGPYLYNYVWQQQLIALDELMPAGLKENLLPSVIEQGSYADRFYSLATFDSGLVLYANGEMLKAVNARLPRDAGSAWSVEEFNELLEKLALHDGDGAVLDLKLNYTGEWFTYAFLPALKSAGADLIDRQAYQSAKGVLNAPAAVKALRYIQAWIRRERVDANVDDAAFISGRVAISWAGHWEYGRYAKALGDKLLLLPLPDFGWGSKTGQGSWSWGITRNCRYPEAAMTFLRFLLRTEEVLAMANANGAVPATISALQKSELYGPQGPLQLLADQHLQGNAVARPRTAAYPVITSVFQSAFQDIRNGANIEATLTEAVASIDQDIKDNNGYLTVVKR